jgi:hypothetical protein
MDIQIIIDILGPGFSKTGNGKYIMNYKHNRSGEQLNVGGSCYDFENLWFKNRGTRV